MTRSLFNSIYVVLISLSIVATAEAARRRSGIPLRSPRTVVLYLFIAALAPVILVFGYAGGAWVGFALAALLMNAYQVESHAIAVGAAIAGVFLVSYLVGIVGIGLGIVAVRLTRRRRGAA
jgi:hypothetical protein